MPRVIKPVIYNKCAFVDCGHEWRPKAAVRPSPYCPRCMRRGWEKGVMPPMVPRQCPAYDRGPRKARVADLRMMPVVTEGQVVAQKARKKGAKSQA
jgi:hypothetical protein